jgi:hypothetical protein
MDLFEQLLKTLATKCGCCGRRLSDTLSQEIGMGPTCRKKYGYDNIDGATSWAHAFSALGAECPADVYEVVRQARRFHDDAGGAKGARKIANYLVKRLALARSGLIAGGLDLCVRFVRALSALGFRTLAARIAKKGLGEEIADVESATSKISILRNGKVNRTLPLSYAGASEAVAACSAAYPIVLVDGVVFVADPKPGDWFVDAETGESISACYEGEERPGRERVVAWEYFARSTAMTDETKKVSAA